MSRQEVRFSGFGGQGIILAGYIVGKAATLYTDLNATLTQSYGPESRGGACAAELVLADEPVHYPHVIAPDVLVAMSQEAYDKYAGQVDAGGLILFDDTLVDPDIVPHEAPVLGVPATHIAAELGRRIVANIVMLGFFTGVTGLVPADAMRQTILASVPKGTEKLNTEAFEHGLAHAEQVYIDEQR
jgi:2-oxoglutarate ferredoxin oxidoreductase subunit gamma